MSKKEALEERITALANHDKPEVVDAIRDRIRQRWAPLQLSRVGNIMTKAEDDYIMASLANEQTVQECCGTMQLQAYERLIQARKALIAERKKMLGAAKVGST